MQQLRHRLAGKYVVVKLSGKALPEEAERSPAGREAGTGHEVHHPTWAQDIVELQRLGAHPVVVHGAGKQIDELSKALGLESKFLGGLRVTDKATLAVAEMVLGSAGKRIVRALQAHGLKALGLSGRDAALLVAEPRSAELGLVGRIVAADRNVLELLCADGFIPVINPIATGPGGQPLNTNADEAAQAVATALGAAGLVLLSDVDGVQGADGRVARATPASIAQLQASGTATGGMLPKLQACADAVGQGVGLVRIARADASVLQALDPEVDLGTLVVP